MFVSLDVKKEKKSDLSEKNKIKDIMASNYYSMIKQNPFFNSTKFEIYRSKLLCCMIIFFVIY